MKEFVIAETEQGIRLDKQLLKILDRAGTGFIYKMLRKKNITLNGKKAEGKERLYHGDVIRIYLSNETFEKFSSDKYPGKNTGTKSAADKDSSSGISSRIIFEDEKLLLVNKPVGILSQKAAADDISINELCLDHLINKGELTPERLKIFKPSVCNRLDRNTSGIIIFAKDYRTNAAVNAALKERTIHKYYLGVAEGRVEKSGIHVGYLSKDRRSNKSEIHPEPSDRSVRIETYIRPLETAAEHTLLEIDLITGRSHQIRAQLSELGHPLLGDKKYGGHGRGGYCLHAYKLCIPGSTEGELKYLAGRTFTARPPEGMGSIIRDLFKVDTDAYMEQQGTQGLDT